MGLDELSGGSSNDLTATANSPTDSIEPVQSSGSRVLWPPEVDIARRRRSSRISERRPSLVLNRTQTAQWWKFTLRPWDDDEEQDWWFASTAIPLLAATIGPLANVFSIAALVTYWRMCLVDGVSKHEAHICHWDGNRSSLVPDLEGQPFRDPRWCYYLNVGSLVVGFIGNFFLLCNFTQRIRYIIALPVTIIMWFIATGILVGITVSMATYVPPISPQETYTQGFWYAVLAAWMYGTCSLGLMFNMFGYLRGHYPQHFQLTMAQRTLILQTMLFFTWLAGGAGVFSTIQAHHAIEGKNWSYVNSLYFCDVTVTTVGFGDLYPTTNLARGLMFPYAVGGIIMLGLMVSSIQKFVGEMSSDKVIRRHVEHSRARTVGRSVTTSMELEHRRPVLKDGERPVISAPMDPVDQSRTKTIKIADEKDDARQVDEPKIGPLRRVATLVTKPVRTKQPKLILLREERDRFNAMRKIQYDTAKFKRWYALSISLTAFALLWCVGALIFWVCERDPPPRGQSLTYFKALYFCYVSLLTIGYGDLAPVTNAGRPVFVIWSLVAVPTMTILVSDLGDTVINKFKHGTFKLADFTILPKQGVWREFLEAHPWLLNWLQQRKQRHEARHRLESGFAIGPEPEAPEPIPTIEELAQEEPSRAELARKLPKKIRETADIMNSTPNKRYTYEEWVEITQLIRFTAPNREGREAEEDEGLIEWDWIGLDSPMMSTSSEVEFVLDRLCESMHRFIKRTTKEMPDDHGFAERPLAPRRAWTAETTGTELEKPRTFESFENRRARVDDMGRGARSRSRDVSPGDRGV